MRDVETVLTMSLNKNHSKEQTVAIMHEGQIFGVEDAFTAEPKKDQNQRTYSCKVVGLPNNYL